LTTPREQINNQLAKSTTYLVDVDNEMVVPVGKKIRLVTTANDVIHSWTIPAFGVKQDAIPGFVRDTWFRAEKTGTFYGQCSELCGKEHAFMPIAVKVVTDAEYTTWVADKKKQMAALADDPTKTFTMDELKQRGEKVYASNCAACHMPNGKGAGAFPALDGSKVVLGAKEGQYKILLQGKNAMPKFTQLNDVELAAVMTYTRNSWGNKTGELIQPKDFTTARAAK
jgi:cytochrome c oxidase subunit 2